MLDRVSFASLVAFVAHLAEDPLEPHEIVELDRLTDFPVATAQPQVVRPTLESVETLLSAMNDGRKIEAIREVRAITGVGLKEAKDAVERHPRKDDENGVKAKRAMLDTIDNLLEIRRDGGIGESYILRHFDVEQLDTIRKFIESFRTHY